MPERPSFIPEDADLTLTSKDAEERAKILASGRDPEVVAATQANLDADNKALKDWKLPSAPPDAMENAP